MDERASFGLWLKQRRKALRFTQEDLAERISCSGAMVRKIEAGERVASQQMADLLAESFGVIACERTAFVQFARGLLSSDAAKRELWQTLHTVQAHPTNLTAPLTALIGREQELERLHDLLLLGNDRLFTLTGPPGIGKTRLSLEVGVELLDHFEDGVFFVGLASVVDPDLVASAIAEALSIPDTGSDSPLSNLRLSLSNKDMLLLLDNFEQVLDASPVVIELLGACPNLKVLATSREALHVHGEQQFPVPALATVDSANLPPIETLGSVPALALFTERARAVKPDFVLTEENAGAVAAICARLDGLPLAIELAAARIRLFSPQEIQPRLDSRLSMLTGGPRNLPARQRTLRAAIDWSYHLLNEEEQTLFARMGVFVGGCTLSAAEVICNGGDLAGGDVPTGSRRDLLLDVGEGVTSLLDKSLLKRVEGVDGESRFTMLEMLREYAVGCVEESGETGVIGRLHAEYFLVLAEDAEPELRGPNQVDWLKRIEQEHDNMRAALRWAETNNETALGLRLALALWWFCVIDGHINEARRWLEGPLAQEGTEPSLRAKALHVAGQAAWVGGDFVQADLYLEQSLALYRDITDPLGAGRTLRIIANLARDRGDYLKSRSYYEQSLAIMNEVGNAEGIALVLISMGENARCENDYGAARSLYERSLGISRDVGSKHIVAVCLFNLGLVEHHKGQAALAEELFKESLQLHSELREKFCVAECLFGLGGVARSEMQLDRAVRLLAAADVLFRLTGLQLNRIDRQVNEYELAQVRKLVDQPTFERLWAEGQALTMEQAIQYALQEI